MVEHLYQSGPLLICLLGSFRLLRGDQPLESLVVGKTAVLLSSLALHRERGMPRDALLELLWPDQQSSQSAVSLRSLVYSLHRRLQLAPDDGPAVVYANGAYVLNSAAGVSTDVARFDDLVAAGNGFVAAGQDARAAACFEQALLLYRGDLVADADVFAVIERERLRVSYLTILAWLASWAFRDGRYDVSLEHALRLLAFDPCREDAHRMVMRAHLRRGERAQALRQYRLCVKVLEAEFDIAPEPETTSLFDRVRLDPDSV